MRAILSVSDKRGLVEFAEGLQSLGVDIFSTGGTKKALTDAGIPAHSVSDITGFPEILDGRVKTLHPAVHGGILARRKLPDHVAQLAKNKIEPIDLIVVNLYPFRETVVRSGVDLDTALENIDIGGPTMIRAAAKNFPDVLVVVDPADYPSVLEQLKKGAVGMAERQKLAQKAFQHVAAYDTAIARYLRKDEKDFPEELTVAMKKQLGLRYGENPHQQAAFYTEDMAPGGVIGSAKQLWGKELSYNNILDSDGAWNAVLDFDASTVAVIKHTNPCGLSSHKNLTEAYRRAFSGDTVAAFGGIVALNRPVDAATAEEVSKVFYEVVIAPGYDSRALEILKGRRDLRILEIPSGGSAADSGPVWDYRHVGGGFLVQTPDHFPAEKIDLKVVTRRQPTSEEIADLLFAWKAVKHVKSNAIVLVRDCVLVGMGAGQPSRVMSVKIALEKAGDRSKGSVLGSDAFFPFPDGVEAAAKGGVTAIMQPGGSVKDDEAIKTANEYNMAMVLTGIRHFKH